MKRKATLTPPQLWLIDWLRILFVRPYICVLNLQGWYAFRWHGNVRQIGWPRCGSKNYNKNPVREEKTVSMCVCLCVSVELIRKFTNFLPLPLLCDQIVMASCCASPSPHSTIGEEEKVINTYYSMWFNPKSCDNLFLFSFWCFPIYLLLFFCCQRINVPSLW